MTQLIFTFTRHNLLNWLNVNKSLELSITNVYQKGNIYLNSTKIVATNVFKKGGKMRLV